MRISDWSSDVCSSDLGVVYRDVVLDFHIVANDDIVGDEDVLPKRAARTDAGPRTDMRPVPDARPLADRRTRIDNGGFMKSHSDRSSGSSTRTPSPAERYMAVSSSSYFSPERPSVSGSALPRTPRQENTRVGKKSVRQ